MQTIMVVGASDYPDIYRVFDALQAAHEAMPISKLLHRGQPGADAYAVTWAERNNIATRLLWGKMSIDQMLVFPRADPKLVAAAIRRGIVVQGVV